MLHLLGKIPDKFVIACSGGVDSMVAAHFFYQGGKNFELVFIDHDTENSRKGYEVVKKWSVEKGIPRHYRRIKSTRPKEESQEEFWRNCRYQILKEFDVPIVMGHHLNDVMETWIFSCLNGQGRLIPYHNENANVIRPFLLNPKRKFYKWASRYNVPFVEDESNDDIRFMRNRIRHCVLPECLKVNPGLEKVLIKKIKEEFVQQNQ